MPPVKSKEEPSLLSLRDVSFSYRYKPALKNISFEIKAGEQWVCLGRNGAGKSSLAAILSGRNTAYSGTYNLTPTLEERGVQIVSFEEARDLRSRERKLDISEFNENAFDPGTTVRDLLRSIEIDPEESLRWITIIGIKHILDRGIRFISTGEMRKVLLAKAILKKPGLIILDNLMDGLDVVSQKSMRALLEDLIDEKWCLLVLCRQPEDVPKKSTHILILEKGVVLKKGERNLILSDIYATNLMRKPALRFDRLPSALNRKSLPPMTDPLLSLENVSVRYGEVQVLKDINWEFKSGQHCHIYGPNGCGKTTLLSLILGDNQKAYGQNIRIFGKLRGSGESIWDIKKKFGQVGTELQLDFVRQMKTLEVVVSGFFDTIGLYKNHNDYQKRHALEWLKIFQIQQFKNTAFDDLSFGIQRMILIIRAMVKSPAILVLDEPTLSMDSYNRKIVLEAIDHIAENSQTQIIFISHSLGERPRCINQELHFKPSGNAYTISVSETAVQALSSQ